MPQYSYLRGRFVRERKAKLLSGCLTYFLLLLVCFCSQDGLESVCVCVASRGGMCIRKSSISHMLNLEWVWREGFVEEWVCWGKWGRKCGRRGRKLGSLGCRTLLFNGVTGGTSLWGFYTSLFSWSLIKVFDHLTGRHVHTSWTSNPCQRASGSVYIGLWPGGSASCTHQKFCPARKQAYS